MPSGYCNHGYACALCATVIYPWLQFFPVRFELFHIMATSSSLREMTIKDLSEWLQSGGIPQEFCDVFEGKKNCKLRLAI